MPTKLFTCLVLMLFSQGQPAASAAEKPLKIMLVTGGCCHDYTRQKDILKQGLEARANVIVDQVHTADSSTKAIFEIYKNPNWAEGYDLIIHDECTSDVIDSEYVNNILRAHEKIPAVNLHCAMHSYRVGDDRWFSFVGIQSNSHGPQEPISIAFTDKEHPITKGLEDWITVREELYNNLKVHPTATPLASGRQKQNHRDAEFVVAWVNDYKGTRVFSTTIGHNTATVEDDRYLDLVTRGTLWAANKLNEDYLKAHVKTKRKLNLAKGGKARASSEESNKENFASKAVDGDIDSRWCANGASEREWLEVDLGEAKSVKTIKIIWEFDGVPYFHQIETSKDGKSWSKVIDAEQNEKNGPDEHKVDLKEVRFLKVTYLGKPGGGWGSIRELQIFNDQDEEISAEALQKETERKHLADVKIPEGFEATIFAAPPMANYPVFVAADVDGTLYVSSDGNGSLGRDPHRGRVLRLRDLDGDGRADESKEFVKDIDSPRGLVWDHDRLYLLHPPHISVFIDKDRDGVADEQKILVKNIAFTFKDRPADHTSNGLELGVDGWLYAAIGDFGFMEAEGTDGRKLQLRAGGVVRVRPDGTGLHLYSRGTRNILETAVSPTLDLFSRDNTNDGGGWDVRFHHHTPLAEHGYPSLYKNFPEEAVTPLSDYGGGSGCGAAWIDEPGIPEKWNNAAFTADWGRNWVYRHRVTPSGASFTEKADEFLGATRVTDLDADGRSGIYVASWKGATFNWAGPEVEYVVRLTPKGFTAPAVIDVSKAGVEQLAAEIRSPSHRRRLAAQRELIRRGLPEAARKAVQKLAADANAPLPSRIAAVFALGTGKEGVAGLGQYSNDPLLREYVIRALGDLHLEGRKINSEIVPGSLADQNPRVRLQAVYGASLLGRESAAVIPLLEDQDPRVAHTAIQALKKSAPVEALFSHFDSPGASATSREQVLKVLRGIHSPAVVEGLISRLEKAELPQTRQGLITALARLYFTEGQWKGDSWGTRPDTSGPYYQREKWGGTEKIDQLFKKLLPAADANEAAHILLEANRHKIPLEDAIDTALQLSGKDAKMIPVAVSQLARAENIPAEGIALLEKVATDEKAEDVARSQALTGLARSAKAEQLPALLKGASLLSASKDGNSGAQRREAQNALLNSARLENLTPELAKIAEAGGAQAHFADAILLRISDRRNASPEAQERAKASLEKGWGDSARKNQILRAVALVEHRPYKDQVIAALEDPASAEAAREAVKALRIDLEKEKKASAAIASLSIEDALNAVEKERGDAKIGEQLFTQLTCANCHTTREEDVPKGPFLGTIAATYKRRELAEAILVPNKSLARGFVANRFELTDGEEHEGFVTLEAADKVVIRNVAAQEITLQPKQIARRQKLEKSLMPDGLAAGLNVRELASLVRYLESLNQK